MTDTVTITRKEYDTLKHDARVLAALEAGGVDNWDWYSESLRDAGLFDEDEEEED